MAVYISSLNSGSNGNCYYIGNENEAVLIDAGISCREIEKRMKCNGLSMEKVKAIFISHEHTDHIRGARVLSKKFQLPVYITPGTLQAGALEILPHLNVPYKAFDIIDIGKLRVKAFPKFHDAADPHSFTVSYEDIHIGIFTDIGQPCEQLVQHFKQCHAVFLEANYDVEMLDKGHYPYHLKQRIKGGHGHLSNHQALELFLQHRPEHLNLLLLSHLSKDNNNPQLVQSMFEKVCGGTKIVVASRYEASPVFKVIPSASFSASEQLKLF
ncbi:MBL fold metallo-hydrolase [Chitinophaga caeni]|uniref:MBL fold metallo-hydrolase n=1 Tax=Chitinophaga caeni TaxID=2029983 RepID=A0A291QZ42_9BACT|nr:MBL fold metallo-hydrolase [Chitinophaga caeni]ATL49152.1 MBL fold metallo-hydrolase [Chitinophaga caeni]